MISPHGVFTSYQVNVDANGNGGGGGGGGGGGWCRMEWVTS